MTGETNGMQHAIVHPDDPSVNPPSVNARQHLPSAENAENLPPSPPQSQSLNAPAHAPPPSSFPLTSGRALTPPFSSSISLHEQASTTVDHVGSSQTDRAREGRVHSSGPSRSSTESPSSRDAPREILSGPKRTASGQVKRSSISSLSDLKPDLHGTRPSRTSSLLSTGSNGSVMELSQQLRTRLNYAMVKVQNGWQTRSLEEVESLASQSPRSSTSGFPHFSNMHSPRSAISGDLHRKWSSSDSSEGTDQRTQRPILNGGSMTSGHPSAAQVMSRRALAPPADIVAGSRRRPIPNGHAPGHVTYSPYQSSLHVSTRHQSKQRTPSQNAAMEADAVETLMFMASPNNSGHHPASFAPHESSLRSTQPTMSQTSPLRSQFSANEMMSPKKVAFAATAITKGKPYDKIADIERMLDDYSDDDSGDDLEEAFNIAQRQQTAGQVR